MRRLAFVIIPVLVVTLGGARGPAPLAAQAVRAVLFHSPSCPHCRQVISQDLPLFFQVYGGNPTVIEPASHLAFASNGILEILFVDASQPEGTALYDASLEAYPVNDDRRGVPRMIIADSVLVGSYEIPSRLHGLIRNGLAAGGIDWPAIPGLTEVVASFAVGGAAGAAAADEAAGVEGAADTTRAVDTPGVAGAADAAGAAGTADSAGAGGVREVGRDVESKSVAPDTSLPAQPGAPRRLEDVGAGGPARLGERFASDPVGNGLAVVVLVLMLGALAAVLAAIPRRTGPREPGFWMPVLIVAGALVSAYLAYVETTGATAVCGPVGDCNTVQQSPYATLFGIVPIGVLGLVGYGLMLVLWVFGLEGRPSAGAARRLLLAVTVAGTAFSIYLTFLEPFVIGATCLWCLSSAAIVTVLAWLSAAWTQRTSAQ
jgi:uncharacterized membrane protein